MIAGTSDDHLVETALTAVAAFGSFLIAEHFGASGVLASVAAGMTMGNLGVLTEKERFGISFTPHGRAFVLEFWEFAAFLANSLVFLLIGSALATVDFAREGIFALALIIALALVGRAVAVYPVCLAFLRTRWAIPLNQQHLMWWGGLRGALALALALALPADLPRRDDVLIAAFAVVAFSVIVQGLTAPLALKALRLTPAARRQTPTPARATAGKIARQIGRLRLARPAAASGRHDGDLAGFAPAEVGEAGETGDQHRPGRRLGDRRRHERRPPEARR